MVASRLTGLLTGFAVLVAGFAGAAGVLAAEASESAALKAKGVVPLGNGYVLSNEAELLNGMKALRQTKAKADLETRVRQAAESKVAANLKAIKDGTKEYDDIERRMKRVTDQTAQNRLGARMNLLAKKVNDAIAAQKDLEDAANKLTSEAKTKYVDQLNALAPRIEEAAEKYKTLADDAAVKAELAKKKATLGPSPDMATAIADIKKWRGEINTEAIPLREENGVQSVEAILNGTSVRMHVSTGNADVLIPADVAKKIDLVPGEKDPTVQLKLLNGQLVDGKRMTLKVVRVGRFTVNNVPCIVLQEGLTDASSVLGASFLSHFVVNLNLQKRELHLTEVKDDKSPPSKGEGDKGLEADQSHI